MRIEETQTDRKTRRPRRQRSTVQPLMGRRVNDVTNRVTRDLIE
jgi:hypothetical protein